VIRVHVSKSFPEFTIDVADYFNNAINVIAGTSGSGKSSLLKMITGFLRPDAGYIQVDTHVIYDSTKRINANPEHRKIGYVPQNYLLFPHLNVFENVAFGLIASKTPKAVLMEKVSHALELCKIEHLGSRYSKDLSGGEKQRVSLARSIVLSPSLLLLDEPFSALDVHTRRFLRSEIRSILKQASIPTIIVTHDPMDALSFGEQVYIMDKGRLIQKGTIEEIKNRPRSRFAAEFTGLNGYYGMARKHQNGMLEINLHNGHKLLSVGEAVGEVLVLIDPSDIMLSREKPNSYTRNGFKATVKELIHESHGKWRLILQGDMEVLAQISSETIETYGISVGDEIYASIKATAIRVEKL
jgi:molybdate transport system ATP-binding protein